MNIETFAFQNVIRSVLFIFVFYIAVAIVLKYIGYSYQIKERIKRICAILLAILEVTRLILHIIFKTLTFSNIEYLPLNLCGWIVIFIVFIELFHLDKLRPIIITLGYPSSILALLIASNDYSIFHFFTIQSIITHGIILLFSSFYFIDNNLAIKYSLLNSVLISIISFTILINNIFDTNFIYLSKAPFEFLSFLGGFNYTTIAVLFVLILFNISNIFVNKMVKLKQQIM